MKSDSYQAVMDQKADIMRASVGIDYAKYATGPLSFDYEAMLADTGYDLEAIGKIQARTAVGDTPLVELKNLTELVILVTPESGKVIVINKMGAVIWDLIDGKRSVRQICDAISAEYDAEPAIIETETVQFLQMLLERGTISVV